MLDIEHSALSSVWRNAVRPDVAMATRVSVAMATDESIGVHHARGDWG